MADSMKGSEMSYKRHLKIVFLVVTIFSKALRRIKLGTTCWKSTDSYQYIVLCSWDSSLLTLVTNDSLLSAWRSSCLNSTVVYICVCECIYIWYPRRRSPDFCRLSVNLVWVLTNPIKELRVDLRIIKNKKVKSQEYCSESTDF